MSISKSGNDNFITGSGCVLQSIATGDRCCIKFKIQLPLQPPERQSSTLHYLLSRPPSRSSRQTLPGHRQPVPRLTTAGQFHPAFAAFITIFSPVFQAIYQRNISIFGAGFENRVTKEALIQRDRWRLAKQFTERREIAFADQLHNTSPSRGRVCR